MSKSNNKSKSGDPNRPAPDAVYSRKILTASEMKSVLKANLSFVEIAKSYLSPLQEFIADEQLSVFLTDGQGCILHIASNHEVVSKLTDSFIIPGSFPDVSNLLGQTIEQLLALKDFVEVRSEKFIVESKLNNWISWAQPIELQTSQLAGILIFCLPEKHASRHIKVMLIQAAICIANSLSSNEDRQKAAKLKDKQLTIFNKHAQADMVVGENGQVQLASDKICELLGVKRNYLEYKNIEELIPEWPVFFPSSVRWSDMENREVEVTGVPNSGLYILNARALVRSGSRPEEVVCNLRSMKQVLNETNKYIGNSAFVRFEDLICLSVPMRRIVKEARRISMSSSPVLILGENHTGRESIAQAIHNHGSRANFGFVKVDLASLDPEEIEETLWGFNEKHNAHLHRLPKPGAFEFANGGTLFLNEVSRLSPSTQDKVLNVLKTGKVNRLGSNLVSTVDVRLICSNSSDLAPFIESKQFRLDLFYSISSASLRIPPLRERRADIPLLLSHFMAVKSKLMNMKPVSIPRNIILILKRYEWSGNFKEMLEYVERVILDQGKQYRTFKNERDFKRKNLYIEQLKAIESIITLDQHEKILVEKAYRAYGGSISKASRSLGISRNTLYLKLKKYGIEEIAEE